MSVEDMNDDERLSVLAYAVEHQYDHDDNADLAIDTEDDVIQAAVRLLNHFGGWHEVSIAPTEELLELINLVQAKP